jgi:hypothetical protein
MYTMKSFFQNFQRTVIVNKTPLKIHSPRAKESPAGLGVYKCLEFEDHYELDVSVLNMSDASGKDLSFPFKCLANLIELLLLSRCCGIH